MLEGSATVRACAISAGRRPLTFAGVRPDPPPSGARCSTGCCTTLPHPGVSSTSAARPDLSSADVLRTSAGSVPHQRLEPHPVLLQPSPLDLTSVVTSASAKPSTLQVGLGVLGDHWQSVNVLAKPAASDWLPLMDVGHPGRFVRRSFVALRRHRRHSRSCGQQCSRVSTVDPQRPDLCSTPEHRRWT